jgi:hypothetical protein
MVSTRWLQIQIEAIATFLIIFGAHMNILKIHVLIGHIGPPQNMLTIEPRIVITQLDLFQRHVFLVSVLGATYCLSIGFLKRKVTE